MVDYGQNPNRLNRTYERRAKAAAWAASLGLFGGAASIEAAPAQPAGAEAEITQQAERSPQAFINSFDKKFAQIVGQMHTSPYFSKLRHKELSQIYHTDIYIYYVGAPSRKYPGNYDWLAVAMRKGEDVPMSASINLGANSKKYANINGIYKEGFVFGQANKSGRIMPHSMALETDNGGQDGKMISNYYGVSSGGYPADLIPERGIKYSDNPAKVSSAFNGFLALAKDMVARRY